MKQIGTRLASAFDFTSYFVSHCPHPDPSANPPALCCTASVTTRRPRPLADSFPVAVIEAVVPAPAPTTDVQGLGVRIQQVHEEIL
jgi:hypothetical protein